MLGPALAMLSVKHNIKRGEELYVVFNTRQSKARVFMVKYEFTPTAFVSY